MCGDAVPVTLPMLTLLMATVVGGGGGVELKVKVTSRPFVPCGADVGLTLEIWLVLVACPCVVPSDADTPMVSKAANWGVKHFMSAFYTRQP